MTLDLLAFVVAITAATPALADGPTGTWLRDTGEAKVRIAACGQALCGNVVWVKDPAHQDQVGRRVFWDMLPDGPTTWKGEAFNPEDGKTYSGKLSLESGAM